MVSYESCCLVGGVYRFMINRIKEVTNSKLIKQTAFLTIAQIIAMVIGFISSMLLAKEMGVELFGIYSFAIAIISFLAIFFEFGYFASVSRLLAINEDKTIEKEIIGASIAIVFGISILLFITIFAISFLVDNIFEDKIGYIIRLASIVSWSFVLPFFMELILKGSNHIEYLSGFNILWKILFLVFIIILYVGNMLIPLYVVLSFSITTIVSAIFFIYKLEPSFINLKKNIYNLNNENKVYGVHLYVGRVIDTATQQLDKLLIGFFVGAKDVGLYSLASSIASPINSFSSALSSSKFKSFSDRLEISKKVLRINLLWIVSALIGANILGFIIIQYYLSIEYYDVQILLFFMSIAIAFQAAYQPYNAWLASNGYGRILKRKSIYTSILSLILNFIFVPLYGSIGAAIAILLFMMHSFILHIYYYKKAIKNEKNSIS